MQIGIGKKIKMTRLFKDSGEQIPVSVIKVIPIKISLIRDKERDGYRAVQILSEDSKDCREFRIEKDKEAKKLKKGQKLDIKALKDAENVDVTGFTKGKGFQGAIKRHGFSRGPMTHGSRHKRKTGAIGQCVIPSRVFKGKKMPGQMGNKQATMKKLEVVKSKGDKLYVKGSVPGSPGNYLALRGN